MIITGSINKVRRIVGQVRKKGKVIGFVPTMGALHRGHLYLVKTALKECDFVTVSIFVNPLQFGPGEDYKKYPRNFKKDEKLLQKVGVNLIFYPNAKTMYTKGFSTFLEETRLSKVLCGTSRPGHFKGVCTVVAKLFNVVGPDKAYFGQKDYQQACIIQRMVEDLNFPIKIKVLPIVREADGLAMSSRNAYLSIQQRKDATVLYASLKLARQLILKGERDCKKIINIIKSNIRSRKTTRIDYVKIKDADSLEDLKRIRGKVLIALAIYLGRTRLIDNIIVKVESRK